MSNVLIALFAAATSHYDLPPGLLNSICYVESEHNIHAVHKNDGVGDSLGACQIKLKTARFMGFKGTANDLMNPRNNVFYAAKYLKYQLKRYKSVDLAVIAYNRGNAKGLTTSRYQAKVFKHWLNKGETYAISSN